MAVAGVAVGTKTYSEEFASFISNTTYEQLPAEAVARVKECVLDQLGVQLVASTLEWNRVVYDYAVEIGGSGESTVIGTSTHLRPTEATFVNATFGQGCELDDSGHAGVATIPTALALADASRTSGQELITAVAVGYEVFFRVFDAVMPQVIERGFHQQGVVGVFASASTAGKLLGLTQEQIVHALGIAGSHASGTAEYDQSGGEVKRLHSGLSTRGGLQAAMLARRGLTGPRSIFEGKRGIFHTFVDHYEPGGVIAGLGQRFEFPPKALFKLYPTVGSIHTAFDAFNEIVSAHSLEAEEIAEIRVGLREYALLHGATIVEPQDAISAQFSLAYSLGLRLVKGSYNLQHYVNPETWRDPAVLAVARTVKPYADPAAVGDKAAGSHVTVALHDGRTFEAYCAHRKGGVENPFNHQDVVDKFYDLAGSVLSRERADKIATMVEALDSISDIRELTSLLTTD